jgi:peptidoglycan/LPS O-acetylase OafA/YrhL
MSGVPDREATFRPDLEGLRAVAVLLVLFYHAQIAGFAGGYVGVDVFFVLSGFFITGIIHRELRRTGKFNLANFYARRVRRLLPAAGATLLVTLVAAMVILPAFRMKSVSADIVSAGFYVSNLHFGAAANDYFAANAAPSPVLHFWSLSLEEQFYLFWPAGLLAARWLPLGRTEWTRISAAIVLVGAASLAAGVWLTGINQPWAFFLLPTRAWELAIGGLLAVKSQDLAKLPRRAAILATPAGICLIIASDAMFNDSTPFPGTAALLPVVGSALVIMGGLPDTNGLPSRLLSIAPMRYLGRISYSLYLWHWPVLVLGMAVVGSGAAPLLAVAAIPVAGLSQRLVEQPMRYGRLIGAVPRWNLLQAASLAVLISVISLGGYWLRSPHVTVAGPVAMDTSGAPIAAQGTPGAGSSTRSTPVSPEPCPGCTIGDLQPPLDSLGDGFFPSCPMPDVSDPQGCVLGSPESSKVIAVFGDSFAWHWMPAFNQIAKTQGIRLLNLVRSACPPAAVTVWSDELNRVDTDCDLWREQAIQRIEAERPSIVVLASSDEERLVGTDGALIPPDGSLDGPHSRPWVTGFNAVLKRLAATGARLVIADQPPEFVRVGLDPIECIADHPDTLQACRANREALLDPQARAVDHQAASGLPVTLVDPADWLCDSQLCSPVIGRYVVYRDAHGHLTAPFALSQADHWAQALGLDTATP